MRHHRNARAAITRRRTHHPDGDKPRSSNHHERHSPLQGSSRGLGYEPDCHIAGDDDHVSRQLLDMNDGPVLEQGIKAIRGWQIRPPARGIDAPDKDRLAIRFEAFLAAN